MAYLDAKIERRFGELDAKIDRVAATLSTKIEETYAPSIAYIERRISELQSALTWRLIAMWATMMLAMVGLYFKH